MASTTALSRLGEERGPPPYFAGRTKELASLQRRLDATLLNKAAAEQGMLLFTGMPGIGKTHLAKHFTAQRRSEDICALHINPVSLASPEGLVALMGRAVGEEDAIARAAGIDAKIAGARALSVGVNFDTHRPDLKLDHLLRVTNHLSVWDKKTLILVVDEIQNVDSQSADAVQTLHGGDHGCPILFVGVGLPHSPTVLSEHGISRTKHSQLEALSPDESVAAIYHGLHHIEVEVDEDSAQTLADASMNFPAHVHGYIEAAATVFDERGEINSDLALSQTLALGKEFRERYYDGRVKAAGKINRLYPLVEHLFANNFTVIARETAASMVDDSTIDSAIQHGVLLIDHQDLLSFGIPSFQTYMQEQAQQYRKTLDVGHNERSSQPITRKNARS